MSSTDAAFSQTRGPVVAIIGAGIAGLCAAVAFAKSGAKVVIFEKADELSEIGASLQLSPNATHILSDLDLLPALENHWIEPQAICMVDGVSLKPVKTLPISRISRDVWGSPYVLMRRTDLQRELLNKVQNTANCELRLGSLLDFSGLNALQTDLEQKLHQRPDLIIGADGVWSQTRQLLPPRTRTSSATGVNYTGYLAWRFMIDASAHTPLPSDINCSNQVILIMNGDGHIALYPPDKNGQSNLVFVTKHDGDPTQLPEFAAMLSAMSLHPASTRMLKSAKNLGCWPINHVADGPWIHKGTDGAPICLIGDAAHAMSPFMAQGAAMAIEDGYVLADLVCNSEHALSASLSQYERLRKARVDKVKARSMMNRITYHARGPLRAGRNMVLSLKSPESLCTDLDWLYGWKAKRGLENKA